MTDLQLQERNTIDELVFGAVDSTDTLAPVPANQ